MLFIYLLVICLMAVPVTEFTAPRVRTEIATKHVPNRHNLRALRI
jgi:hypothetical protein